MSTVTTLVPLRRAAGLPMSEVGGKAANLASLLEAGLPVPDGFVIPSTVFSRFVDSWAFGPGTTPDEVRNASLPPELVDDLHPVIEALGHLVAVRSSGAAEDLEGASYAGLYESVLGVALPEAEKAILSCWGSAFHDRLLSYHQTRNGSALPPMAVLIQRMVPAETAGVAFSADPVTGDRDKVVIDAVRGLADRLVAGEINAEQWSVRHGHAALLNGDDRVLDPTSAVEVAELTIRVEKHFGNPQDVEWAISGSDIHILQARPITTLLPDAVPPEEVPPGYWERETSHAPRPLSPYIGSFFFEIGTEAIRDALSEFAPLLETIEYREIGGWAYVRPVPLGGKDRPPPPAWLMPLLIRLVPSLRRRIRRCVEAMRSDVGGRMVDRWYHEWRPELVGRTSAVRSVELAELSDEALAGHARSIIDLAWEGARIHFRLHLAVGLQLAELAFATKEILGWEESKVWELLAGLSQASTEQARQLASLAEMVAAHPALRKVMEQGELEHVSHLRAVDSDFAAAFTAYLEEFGHRPLAYDVSYPTLAESPQLVLRLIGDQLAGRKHRENDEATATRDATLAEARAALGDLDSVEQSRWERALSRAQTAYPVREDNVFYTISAVLALARYDALEIGRRLARRSQLATADDVFYLTFDEALDALEDGHVRTVVVEGRQAKHAWAEGHPGPPSYGDSPGPPPSLAALPEEARFVNEAVIWYFGHVFGTDSRRTQEGGQILGIAASPGRYQGRVRVVRNEAEFDKLQPGDVLVCPVTTPVWSVVFPSIGALVTDSGGILSHAAIIAREHRIPAVVATGNATQLLRDGLAVTVDGNSGRVETA